jgi:hypothetical protein
MATQRNKAAHHLLLGTWRSDRARTESQWVWPKKLAAKRRREWFAIFGHLTNRFTRTRCYTTYEGKLRSVPYRVLWQGFDVFPQLVLVYGTGTSENALHIFFDSDDSYYVQGGKCSEFFKREK